MKAFIFLCFFSISTSLYASPLWLRYPSISPNGEWIAFNYQGDIFVVSSSGGIARQITSHESYDYNPIWSHDSKQIAFASNRFGNFDVFLTDIEGNTPTRLTFHSSNDIPNDFTIDNQSVIFTAARLDNYQFAQFPYRGLNEVYQVDLKGGREIQFLTIAAEKVKFNKKGDEIIFQNKKGYENEWRKHHQSSVTRDIVTYNLLNKTFNQLTNWNGEDRDPVYGEGENFYFLSEKSGTFNIWKGTKSNPYQKQVTEFKTHPIRFLSRSNNDILSFSYQGELYTHIDGKSKKLEISIHKDLANLPSHLIKVNKASGDFALSPNNKEMAFIHRGDVYVTSIDYSSTKQITNTPGMERSVSFSPDGKKVLYAAERNDSWNIYESEKTREEEKYFFNASLIKETPLISNDQETFQPAYSPDGKEIAFLENRTAIKVYNIKSKKSRTILAGKYNYSYSDGDQYYHWSPDSKYILAAFFEYDRWSTDIGLIDVNSNAAPINLTKSGYGNDNAKFAMNGNMVYYSTDKYGYRSHGSWGAENDVEAIFLNEQAFKKFTLNKEDYEFWMEENKKDSTLKEIIFEPKNLFDRKVRLTIHSSNLMDFYVDNEATKILYLTNFEKGFDLWQTDFREKETKIVVKLGASPSSIILDSLEKNIYLLNKGNLMKVDAKSFKPTPVKINAESNVNYADERKEMFYHAWRQVREKFYVKSLHGVDWNALRNNYAQFLPHINNGYDFAELLSEILGELNASHTGGMYRNYNPNGDQTAALGCYFDESYNGDGLKIIEIMDKSPLMTISNKIEAGCIIEAIDGVKIEKNKNYYHLLNRKIGKKVLISFLNPKTKDKWDEIIIPIHPGQEAELAYERWIKKRSEIVDKLSNGKLGYVHIKGMNSSSFRELYDKALGELNTKDALIIDTRFNGGGWLHDDLATFLSGKLYMKFMPRGQTNMGGEPISKWQKPSCVLMSEGNYSDAHLFPYTYKALGIGKLIGMPVPGTGTAVWWETLIDNKTVFGIPQVGMQSISDQVLVENQELQPDIKINNTYKKMMEGIDEQLISAINELQK